MKNHILFFLPFCVLTLSCNQPMQDAQTPDKDFLQNPVIKPAEGVIKILWLEKEFDPEFNSTVEVIRLNQPYFENIDEAEKAVIGYYASFHGNECWWENNMPNEERSNLRCKIIDALKLGYQCSDTHIGFLKKWFRTQPHLLQELDHCITIPNTSTQQDRFEEIIVERKKDVFTIRFTICAQNLRNKITHCYEEIHSFRIFADAVEEIKPAVL